MDQAPNGPASDATRYVRGLPPVPRKRGGRIPHWTAALLGSVCGASLGSLVFGDDPLAMAGGAIVFFLLGWSFGYAVVGTRLIEEIDKTCRRLKSLDRADRTIPFLELCLQEYPDNLLIKDRLTRARREAGLEPTIPEIVRAELREEAGEAVAAEPPPDEAISAQAEVGEPEAPPAPAPPPPPPQPAAPVVSGLAVAAWVLAVFAVLPFAGVPAALALLILGAILLLFPRRRLDRPVGFVSIVLAGTGIALTLLIWLGATPADIPLSAPATSFPWPIKVLHYTVLLFSVVLHECAHAMAAWWSGDETAKKRGRLSLNPLVHLDLIGSVILPGILLCIPGAMVFGWAKPVPVDPRAYRRSRRARLGVALSGVGLNAALAFGAAGLLAGMGITLRLIYPGMSSQGFALPWVATQFYNLPGAAFWVTTTEVLKATITINLLLLNLNLLPLPPLDGARVVEALAPRSVGAAIDKLSGFGFLAMLVLVQLEIMTWLLLPGIIAALVLNGAAGILCGLP